MAELQAGTRASQAGSTARAGIPAGWTRSTQDQPEKASLSPCLSPGMSPSSSSPASPGPQPPSGCPSPLGSSPAPLPALGSLPNVSDGGPPHYGWF